MNAEKSKTILLVEDEVIIALAEKTTLEKYGYLVRVAHSGEEAIAAVAATPGIDLILMDINLGAGMDGTEAAALILKERDLPVVFLSSHVEPDVVARTEKITSYGYVVKNSSVTVLDASIKMAFKLFEAKIQAERKDAALIHSHELMKYIIEHMHGAVAVHDRELRYIYVSQRYLDEYKVTARDVIGRHHYDVFPDLPQKWRDVHQKALAGEISSAEDDPFPRQDGSVEWTRWECRPWYEADGSIGGIIVYTEVTTGRKLVELKLAQSLDLLTKLARLVPGVIYQYRLDPDGRSAFPYASPGMNDIYEVSPEEVREDATPVFGRLHPDDYDMVAGAIQASALTLNTFFCEFRVLLPRQGLRWRWSQAHPERLPDGGTLWHGIISDITERKLAEEELKASEARAQALLRTIPDLLFRVNRRGVFLDYRADSRNLHDQSGASFIGKSCREILPPDFSDLIDAKIRFALETGALLTFNYQLLVPGRGMRDFEARMIASGADEVMAIVRDVTENNRAESQREAALETLRATEARWRDILFSMADWVWEVDENGVYTFSSDKGLDLLGVSRGDIVGKTPFDFMPPEEAKRVGAIFARIIANKEVIRDLENWNISKNGERICLLTNGVPVLDEKGNLKGYRGVDKDITGRKQAEEVINNSLRFQQALLDAVPSPIFYKDADLVYSGGNKAFAQYIGLEREQFIGKTVFDIAPADLAEKYDKADRELLKEQGVQTYEASVVYADGSRHEVIFNKAVFVDAEGRTAGMIGVILDISERKRTERALQENNSRLELAMQAADMAWWEMDLASGRVIFEERKAGMLGFPPERFKHYLDFMALVHPDDQERAMNAMRGHLDGTLPRYEVDYRIATRSGEYIWFHDLGSIVRRDADGKPLNVTGLVINITERKQIEAARRQSEEKYRILIENSHDIIYTLNLDGIFTFVSPSWTSLLGQPLNQVVGKPFAQFVHADDLAGCMASIQKMILTGQRQEGVEYRVRHADGSWRWHITNAVPIRDAAGAIIGGEGIARDITESKLAEDALYVSEARLANALQMTNSGHWEYDVDRDLFTFNDNFYRIFRTTAAAVGGYQMSAAEYARRFCHPDDAPLVGMETQAAIAASDPAYSRQIEHRFFYADGGIGHLAVRFFIVKDAHGRTIRTFGVNQDISERKRAEEEIKRQLQEKETLLQEVHHRIKNNIAAIGGILSLSMQRTTSPEALAALQDAIGRVDSMRLLYEKLLRSEDYQNISVKKYIESLTDAVVSLFPDQAKVRLDQGVDDFNLDPKRLFPLGIIINELLTNIMKYAFAGKKSGQIKLSLAKAGSRVTLVIQDNGVGLPDGFEAEGEKGFGLTLVKMLSQQLGGTFAIEKHKGTRCTVQFDV